MFITCLTKDFSCFRLIEKANNDSGILTLDNKTGKKLSVSYFLYTFVCITNITSHNIIFTDWTFPASNVYYDPVISFLNSDRSL